MTTRQKKQKPSRQELRDRMVDTYIEYARRHAAGMPPGDRGIEAYEAACASMTAVIDVLRSVLEEEQDRGAAKNIRSNIRHTLDMRRMAKGWITELKRRAK